MASAAASKGPAKFRHIGPVLQAALGAICMEC